MYRITEIMLDIWIKFMKYVVKFLASRNAGKASVTIANLVQKEEKILKLKFASL